MAGRNAPSDRDVAPAEQPEEARRDISPSASTDQVLMAEVHLARASQRNGGPGKACEIAMQQYVDTSPDIFKVKSGEFKGYRVPEALRCATFQSNVAERAGLINPSDITIRALEFGDLMRSKGYREETFKPGQKYPDGTYIIGEGARDGTNSRHVGMICEGRLLHTNQGRIRNQAVSDKFFPGAYDSMRVYIPPRGMRSAELDPSILQA